MSLPLPQAELREAMQWMALLALLGAAICGGLQASRRYRVSLGWWVLGPSVLAFWGTVSGIWQLQRGLSAMPAASPAVRPAVAADAMGQGLFSWMLGWQWALVLLILCAWFAALGTLRGESDDPWQPIPALAVAGAVGCTAFGVWGIGEYVQQPTLGAYLPLFAGLPMAVAVLRGGGDEDSWRSHAIAVVVGLCVLAATAGFLAMVSSDLARSAIGWAKASMETRRHLRTFFTSGGAVYSVQAVGLMGVCAIVLSAMGGLVQITWGGRALDRRFWVGRGVALVLFVPSTLGALAAGIGPMRQLVVHTAEWLGDPTDRMFPPEVAAVQPPTHREVSLMLSHVDLVVSGRWVFDLDRTEQGSRLPVDAASKLQSVPATLAHHRRMSSTLLVQIDRNARHDVVAAVLEQARVPGFARIELVAVGPDAVGVIEVPPQWDAPPDATLQELLDL